MMSAETKLGFARSLLLPALMLFVVPVFAAWFAEHAARTYDQRFVTMVLESVAKDASLPAEQKARASAFYRNVPPSVACASGDPELASYREGVGDGCSDYAQFAWARRIAWGTVALGAGAVLFALLCSLAAFVSRPMQYASFALGWNVLKVVGAVETVLQGGLLVWLSFWMTAVWTERYFVKLILITGVLAAMAAYKVLLAIFSRPSEGLDVEGEVLSAEAAPALWARVRELCAKLGTAPPDHIVAGIDDNFFVTESLVRVGEQALDGRVLYVSLSLLRVLHRAEADAVLAHEMAHLRGGDTGHSRKLAPLLTRYAQYLGALHENVIARPVFYFMLAYFALFQLALSRSHREAEFAADAVAAQATSALDIARSLIKVGAYASYRQRVEEAVFQQNQPHAELSIAARVASGFSSYAKTEALYFDLHEAVTPHPFDSHPPLRERIAALNVTLPQSEYEPVLLAPVESSWADTVSDAARVEANLWGAYQERFHAAHELALAYRYEPANDSEREHVERFFPEVRFDGKAQESSLRIDFAGLYDASWEAPVRFEDIHSAEVEERLFKKYLDLKLKGDKLLKDKRSVCLSKLESPDALLEAFNRYYGRHQMMVQHRSAAA